jgi:hypothetical protein
MHVVWKRPDGFHGAVPTDFEVVELDNQTCFWLHKNDRDWFPFRISGGWQESEATKRLNNLINLLSKPNGDWLDALLSLYHNSMSDECTTFYSDLSTWVGDLRNHLKGDTWETDIMNQALAEVAAQLNLLRDDFLKKANQ